ncbi:putative diguanylate cyclase YegE [Hartmannibacter diazotrophicus]|uniref:Putative diguanylate cyclase YegE n=1 Tax=Hartmannibacter diazotrophicus TaxID=1482074 RepID=A0A2C9DC13_9HYPH|nr:GGDEF domain-containing protein [Hartmannibacter diazotrophicus]SON57864.1 putative diguanylate cyclase YegE [Hartmannibacter diazotrophicus]
MGDVTSKSNPGRLKRDIYVAASLTVIAFVITLFFIVDRASVVANGLALQDDFELLNTELANQRRSAEVTMNEATTSLDGLATMRRRDPDMDFMIQEMKTWITEDYGIRQVLVVDGAGVFRFAMQDGNETAEPSSLPLSQFAVGSAERARAWFEEVKPQLPKGWELKNARQNDRARYVLSDFATVDGQFGMILAQVVVPFADDGIFMEGDGQVNVAFRPLDYGGLDAAAQRLSLRGFRVASVGDSPDIAARLEVASHDGTPAFALLWDKPDPRTPILLAVLPLGVALVCAIVALLAIMLRRYRLALHELAASEELNRRLANHDALTGLANRAQFDRRLDSLIKSNPRDGFAVMCIDLDKFKAVNDTYGHNAGDAVLVAAASRFAERIGEKGLVARTGGDEFVALVTSGVDPRDLKMLGECLIADACLPVPFESNDLQIGASIGVSIFPGNGRTAKDIINSADQVLYDSKRAGRGRCTLAEQSVRDADRTSIHARPSATIAMPA